MVRYIHNVFMARIHLDGDPLYCIGRACTLRNAPDMARDLLASDTKGKSLEF